MSGASFGRMPESRERVFNNQQVMLTGFMIAADLNPGIRFITSGLYNL